MLAGWNAVLMVLVDDDWRSGSLVRRSGMCMAFSQAQQ
jgi:hypothetical protein